MGHLWLLYWPWRSDSRCPRLLFCNIFAGLQRSLNHPQSGRCVGGSGGCSVLTWLWIAGGRLHLLQHIQLMMDCGWWCAVTPIWRSHKADGLWYWCKLWAELVDWLNVAFWDLVTEALSVSCGYLPCNPNPWCNKSQCLWSGLLKFLIGSICSLYGTVHSRWHLLKWTFPRGPTHDWL